MTAVLQPCSSSVDSHTHCRLRYSKLRSDLGSTITGSKPEKHITYWLGHRFDAFEHFATPESRAWRREPANRRFAAHLLESLGRFTSSEDRQPTEVGRPLPGLERRMWGIQKHLLGQIFGIDP